MNQIDLNGRHAVVTGGAQGIGLSVTTRLLSQAHRFRFGTMIAPLLEMSLRQLEKIGVVTGQVVDVADASAVDRAVTAMIDQHHSIDILVANAGIAGPNHTTWEYPVEEWRRVVNVNLLGVYHCCRAIVPHMLRSELRANCERCLDRGQRRQPQCVSLQCIESWGHCLDKVAW